jgi:hypothetical protein
MDEIAHCELLYDRLIIIFKDGKRFCLSKDEAIKLAFGIVRYKDSAADLSDVFQEGFKWNLKKRYNNLKGEVPISSGECAPCQRTNWKPEKPKDLS